MRRSLTTVVGNLSALFDETITTAIIPMQGQLTAVAAQVTTLDAKVDDVEAQITIKAEVGASPGGGWSRYGMYLTNEAAQAAFFIDLNGSQSRIVNVAGQYIITDGVNSLAPFVFEGGEAKMMAARIGTIHSGLLQSFDGKMVIALVNKRISIST